MSRIKGSVVWADYQEKHMPELRDQTSSIPSANPPSKDYAIVFIEPRCHPASEFVLRNLRYHAPSASIVVVHGTKNEEYLKTIVASIRGDFIFIQSGVDDLPPPAYNALLTSPAFWTRLADIAPWAVIAQSDSILLQSIDAIRPYMASKYSFVGAPWSHTCSVCGAPMDGGCGHMIDQAIVASIPSMVGNGGFSLRCVADILQVLDAYAGLHHTAVRAKWPAGKGASSTGATNEDVLFCKALELMQKPRPSRAEALAFCIEQVGPLDWTRATPMAIACHKPWAYLHPSVVQAILA